MEINPVLSVDKFVIDLFSFEDSLILGKKIYKSLKASALDRVHKPFISAAFSNPMMRFGTQPL